MRRKNLFLISLLFQHKHISLHRLGYLEVALHIIGSVDGVHRRLHRFCDFPEFPLHCLFVKLIQICHNSYFAAKIAKQIHSSKLLGKKTNLRHTLPPLPLLCRNLIPLSQQLRQESGKFLGINPKSPYLCSSKSSYLIRVYS